MNYTLSLGIIAFLVVIAYIAYTLRENKFKPKVQEVPPEEPEEKGPDAEGGGNNN